MIPTKQPSKKLMVGVGLQPPPSVTSTSSCISKLISWFKRCCCFPILTTTTTINKTTLFLFCYSIFVTCICLQNEIRYLTKDLFCTKGTVIYTKSNPDIYGINELLNSGSGNSNSTSALSNNDNDENNNQQHNRLPMVAVVHIGPHKTGTTTIQSMIEHYTNELLIDHYETPVTYLGSTQKVQLQQLGGGALVLSPQSQQTLLQQSRGEGDRIATTAGMVGGVGTGSSSTIPGVFGVGNANHFRFAHCLKDDIFLRSREYIKMDKGTDPRTGVTTITQTLKNIVPTNGRKGDSNNDVKSILARHRQIEKDTCESDYFVALLRIAGRQNHVVLSAERFATSEVKPTLVATVLLPWRNHIHIIGYYRRFYDWIISWHNQLMKAKPITQRQPIIEWINDQHRIYDLYNTIYIMGSIPRYETVFLYQNDKNPHDHNNNDYDTTNMNHNNNHNIENNHNQIHIFNVHEPEHDLIQDFFCSALPYANHTCETIQKETQQRILLLQQEQQEQQQQQVQEAEKVLELEMNQNSSSTTTFHSNDTATTTTTTTTTLAIKNSANPNLVYEEIAYEMMIQWSHLTRSNKERLANENATKTNTNHNNNNNNNNPNTTTTTTNDDDDNDDDDNNDNPSTTNHTQSQSLWTSLNLTNDDDDDNTGSNGSTGSKDQTRRQRRLQQSQQNQRIRNHGQQWNNNNIQPQQRLSPLQRRHQQQQGGRSPKSITPPLYRTNKYQVKMNVTSNRYKMYMATIQPTYTLRGLTQVVHDHHQSLMMLNHTKDTTSSSSTTTTISSFPPEYVRCPSPTALQYLYTLSMKAERKYGRSGTIHAGGTYIYHDQKNKNNNNDNNEIEEEEIVDKEIEQRLHYEKRKKELKMDFDKSSHEVNRLCTLNVKALLQNDVQWNLFWQTLLIEQQQL